MEPDYSSVKVFLLDIEGTVCPISFVKDVLFPYALAALPSTLATDWDAPTFAPYRSAFPPEHQSSPTAFAQHVHALTASDTKAPYLKALQGHLWARGYASGALSCPLFPDVAPCLRAWTSPCSTLSSTSPSGPTAPPLTVIIYSSGSIPAQKLLFSHTTADGDLTPLLSGYFDTVTAGPKTFATSYARIVEACAPCGADAAEWLFLSDSVAEVQAALEAGLRAAVVRRVGNAPLPVSVGEGKEGLHVVDSFEELGVRTGVDGRRQGDGVVRNGGEE